MRAIVQNRYGSPAVLELKEIDRPVVEDDGVLVQVHAAALHAGDYFVLTGVPWLVRFAAGWPRPRNYVPGFDLAGRVEAVGRNVNRFRPGDEVFAACDRACAEYARGPERTFALKPTNLTFEILDNVANRPFSECRRALTPGGTHIPNSGRAGMGYIVQAFMRSAFVGQQGRPFVSTPNHEDMVLLKNLIESGKLKPIIDRTYRLSEAPEAIGYIGEGHARGKVVITMERDRQP